MFCFLANATVPSLLHSVVVVPVVCGWGSAAHTIGASIHGLQVLGGPAIAQACKTWNVLGHKKAFRSGPNLTPSKAVLNAFALRQLQNTLAFALINAIGRNYLEQWWSMMVAISSLLLALDSIDELSKSMDPEIKCKCAIPKGLRFSNWLTE